MRIVKVPGGKILIRENPKELPIDLFTEFQKYVIQDVGIGTKIADVEKHYHNLDSFIAKGMIEEAAHYGLILAINRISIQHCSFAVLVSAVNNRPVKDYSESNLKNVIKKMSDMGLTQEHVEDILETVKKNLILN
jgi:hypothetical protein